MATQMDRSKRIQIRVSEDVYNRMQTLADDYGIAHSTLASIAVSEFLLKKERELSIYDKAKDSLGNQFEEMRKFLIEQSE